MLPFALFPCGIIAQVIYSIFYVAGMLWTGETPEVRALEENMAAYFNTLQGFLLLSHGSTVGAGPTLYSCMHASVKQIVDFSFKLFMESVSSYGNLSLSLSLSQCRHTHALGPVQLVGYITRHKSVQSLEIITYLYFIAGVIHTLLSRKFNLEIRILM